MACLSRDPGGRRRILFMAPDGKRRCIRLGKMPQKAAESVLCRVEALATAAMAGIPWDSELAEWVGQPVIVR